MKTMITVTTDIVITMITAMMAAEIPKTDISRNTVVATSDSRDCY